MGTSLAIESLNNLVPDRPHVKPVPITQIDILLVNVRTVYRNMLGGIKAAQKDLIDPADIPDYIFQEMQQIKAAVGKISHEKVEVYFYLCRYPDVKREFPHAQLVEPTTLKQRQAKEMEDQVISAIALAPQQYGAPKIFDYYVEAGGLVNDRVAMLTHIPLDLVNRSQFKELYLLESNTGAFKRFSEFGSKFKVKPHDAHFPFSAFTLQILGDGNKMFMPQATDIIHKATEIARAGKWTYMTTAEKVKHNLANAGGDKFVSFLKTLFRS